MGGTNYSADVHTARSTLRAKSGSDGFDYHKATTAKPRAAWVAHASVDPKRKAGPTSPFAGGMMRESRDSMAHPNSKAVAILLDGTGSMSKVPRMIQADLNKLMGLLIRKGYLADPQILIGCIGDAADSVSEGPPDRVPLQIGQFESGIEIDDDITNLLLEGGGGGQKYESYDLGLYFMARHTAMDCLEKRGEKGYLIIIGDEMCRSKVDKEQLKRVLDISTEADIPIATIIKEVEAKFDVYFILPNLTSYYNDMEVHDSWAGLLTNAVVKLEDPAGISAMIATIIGVAEGKTSLASAKDDMTEMGTELSVASAVTDALTKAGVKGAEKGTALAVADSGEPGGLATV